MKYQTTLLLNSVTHTALTAEKPGQKTSANRNCKTNHTRRPARRGLSLARLPADSLAANKRCNTIKTQYKKHTMTLLPIQLCDSKVAIQTLQGSNWRVLTVNNFVGLRDICVRRSPNMLLQRRMKL